MWTLSDINALPTESDLVHARKAISALEEELNLAELRVEKLKEELKTLRIWITPIRRLPFDILSPIFTLCGEMDRKSPVSISAVCRAWRETVVNTPGAWFLVQVKSQKNTNLFGVYLARCRQRLLHATLQQVFQIPKLAPYAHGIQCIQVPDLQASMEDLCFPYLKSLRISSEASQIRLTQIAATHFPSMRHLQVAGTVVDQWDAPSVDLPPIDSLTLTFRSNHQPRILRDLCKKPIFLAIYFTGGLYNHAGFQVHLPKVRCLKLIRYTTGVFLPITLVTPILETYIQQHSFRTSSSLIHRKVDTITHLWFSDISSLGAFPMVRVLQLSIPAYEQPQALRKLEDQNILPNLEPIEFVVDSRYDVPTDDWVKQHRPKLNLIVSERKSTIILPAYVFAICAEMDWKCSLVISAVCRKWRDSILGIPKAWTAVLIDYGDNVDFIADSYYRRRGQSLLHVRLLDREPLQALSRHARGIQCISVPEWYMEREDFQFPDLTCLRITKCTSVIWLSQVTTAQFPALWHLHLAEIRLYPSVDIPTDFPPLHTLTVVVGKDRQLIRMEDFVPLRQKVTITLGKLQCLRFALCTSNVDAWPVELITPRLVTYVQEGQAFTPYRGVFHQNIRDVTHFRLGFVPALGTLRAAQKLQLLVTLDQCAYVIHTLTKAGRDCPELKLLELCIIYRSGLSHVYGQMDPKVWDQGGIP
ncbi:hypothetical protein M408DRAFT_23092 [Serendipita vermifera MAFF 305830]|uniref:F-box domain-containing protein n=1 Tax=Serendipita vermifera MAFF 305830 TaxID=933852 RepID=A0A0C2XJT5_SERVB|nr:hypothetical protein M408DRAFT_23092 [Serendipita vermifera MAFF 305830]